MLKRRSGQLVEIQHAVRSNTGEINNGNLQSLSYSLRKLQTDLNSCLTEIVKQEAITVRGPAAAREGKHNKLVV